MHWNLFFFFFQISNTKVTPSEEGTRKQESNRKHNFFVKHLWIKNLKNFAYTIFGGNILLDKYNVERCTVCNFIITQCSVFITLHGTLVLYLPNTLVSDKYLPLFRSDLIVIMLLQHHLLNWRDIRGVT